MKFRSASAYAFFFLAGAVVARFQYHIAFDLDRSGLVQYYVESIIVVPVLGILGLILAFSSKDPLLQALAAATWVLFGLQLLSAAGPIYTAVLNTYARIYAVSCFVAPLASAFVGNRRARLLLFVSLSALVIVLSAAWSLERGALVIWHRNPTEQDLLLIAAAESGDLARMRQLINAGGDLGARDEAGRDALWYAARKGHLAEVRLLVARGADPASREDRIGMRNLKGGGGELATGCTALMMAAANGHRDVVLELLTAGADPGSENAAGETASAMAERAGHRQISRLLQEAE